MNSRVTLTGGDRELLKGDVHTWWRALSKGKRDKHLNTKKKVKGN